MTRVADVQLEVKHGRALRLLVLVMSARPKFKPVILMEVLVVACRFWKKFVMVGLSKDSSSCPVPAIEPTLTEIGNGPLLGMASKNALSVGVAQAKAVFDVHVEETHGIAPAKSIVGVIVSIPKFVPRNETGAPAERGMFPRMSLTTGASKVKNSAAVPVTLLNVASAHVTSRDCIDEVRHLIVVLEVHDDVGQRFRAIDALCVSSPAPKFNPQTVTEAPPE